MLFYHLKCQGHSKKMPMPGNVMKYKIPHSTVIQIQNVHVTPTGIEKNSSSFFHGFKIEQKRKTIKLLQITCIFHTSIE